MQTTSVEDIHFPDLLKQVATGKRFLITENGMPKAKLLPFTKGACQPLVESAISAYNLGHSTAVISKKLGVTPAKISYWARLANLPARKRGRRAFVEPSAQHKAIILRFENNEMALESVAREFAGKKNKSVSRQYIHHIYQRWLKQKNGPLKKIQFNKGDSFTWCGLQITVMKPGTTSIGKNVKLGTVKIDGVPGLIPFDFTFSTLPVVLE